MLLPLQLNNLLEPAAGVDNLLAEDVSSVTSVTTPTIGQEHALLADDVSSVTSVTTPQLIAQILLADDISAVTTTETVALGQVHVLLANDLISLTTVTNPAIDGSTFGDGTMTEEEWFAWRRRLRRPGFMHVT